MTEFEKSETMLRVAKFHVDESKKLFAKIKFAFVGSDGDEDRRFWFPFGYGNNFRIFYIATENGLHLRISGMLDEFIGFVGKFVAGIGVGNFDGSFDIVAHLFCMRKCIVL